MNSKNWLSAWCSVIGSSHILENLPCQDSSKVEYLVDSDFVIAAVSDGAGSCENSHLGSHFLVDYAIEKVAITAKLKGWLDEPSLINDDIWRLEAFNIFSELKRELLLKSQELNIEFKTLSATLIILISNGDYTACAHVGDGRAAIRNDQGEWKSIITPTKGEEANQTLFITSDLWDNVEELNYFGTFFYSYPITAFCLLSDGCERASFEILKYNESEDKYFDPNLPFKPFFEPNYSNLIKMNSANLGQEKINELWGKFLKNGTPALANETDDKSLILSVDLSRQ